MAGYPGQFKFTLVPFDMKWLATFAAELSNAATSLPSQLFFMETNTL